MRLAEGWKVRKGLARRYEDGQLIEATTQVVEVVPETDRPAPTVPMDWPDIPRPSLA